MRVSLLLSLLLLLFLPLPPLPLLPPSPSPSSSSLLATYCIPIIKRLIKEGEEGGEEGGEGEEEIEDKVTGSRLLHLFSPYLGKEMVTEHLSSLSSLTLSSSFRVRSEVASGLGMFGRILGRDITLSYLLALLKKLAVGQKREKKREEKRRRE